MRMNTTLRLRPFALALALVGSIATLSTPVQAQSATTDPVGYYTVTIVGGADNVLSLPMVRDAVFAGTVAADAGDTNFTALAGSASPGWAASQWVYDPNNQHITYYAEITSGALKGLYYQILANGTNSLTLDTEGDHLNSHPLPGGSTGKLLAGDSFKIRPYWRVKDVFESNNAPIIQPKTGPFDTANDEILFPFYTVTGVPSSTGINKPATLILYYLNGTGWQANGQSGAFDDQILRPNESVVVRRRASTSVTLTNLGNVLMNRSVYFFPGGTANSGNDTYFSIARPAGVSLNASGLRIADQQTSAVIDTPSDFQVGLFDEVLAFDVPAANAGFNRPPTHTYYYLAGGGWREAGTSSTTVGDDVILQPGRAYILRKAKNTLGGRDWPNDPNY
jgi:uncharacterized protein (TIGR02597 family)